MPSFAFVARETGTGREVRSAVEAVTEQAAIATLLNRNLLVISIEERLSKRGRTSGGRVALHDLVIFTRQLATMIDAGLAMVQSLQALAEQTTNKVMRDVIRDVCTRVEGGDSFSEALQKHPKVFTRLYRLHGGRRGKRRIVGGNSGAAGNVSGKHRAPPQKGQIGDDVSHRGHHRGHFNHHLFAGEGGAGVRGHLFRFRRKLPGPTLYMIKLSEFVQRYILLLLIGGGAVVYGWFYFIKTKPGREFWDRYRIRMPIFGVIAHKICLARFTRTLASLIRSGVPILEVLQIVSQTVGNVVMEKAIRSAAGDIERGEGISTAIGKHPVFPTMIVRMITAGEQTGKIDNMLERVADFLDEEIETTLSGLTSLIEPILIVFLGVVIGGMVICMFLPIFKMSEIVNPSNR